MNQFKTILTKAKSREGGVAYMTQSGLSLELLRQLTYNKLIAADKEPIMADLPKKNVVYSGYRGSEQLNLEVPKEYQRYVVRETKTHFVLNVPAFGNKGTKYLGCTQSEAVKVNEIGLKWLKANLTLRNIHNLNRAEFTDVRNDLARSAKYSTVEDATAAYKAEELTLAQYVKVLELLSKGGDKKAKEIHSGIIALIPK